MKKLYIIRHAKSSWKDMTLEDFERPLNKRGKSDAPLMGTRLKKKNIFPDLILSSPALRAKITAKVIAQELGYTKNINFVPDFYEANVEVLHTTLRQLNNKHESIFIFGHNPSFNMLAGKYVDFNENIPTCGTVEIHFDCKKWKSICRDNASFISFDYPKK